MNRGMSYAEAANGIGADLSEQGVFMRTNRDVITSARYTGRQYLDFVATAAQKNVAPILRTITYERSFGSPWLFALVVLGLLGSAWDRKRFAIDGPLLLTGAIFVGVLLTVQALWFRYFITTLGVLLYWTAHGAEELRVRVTQTAHNVGVQPRPARVVGEVVAWGAIALVLVTALRALPYEAQFSESLNRERRAAGEWLQRQGAAHQSVMDVGLQVAYYARADLMYLPYADGDTALRYVAKKNPDYIVLVDGSTGGLPYTAKWFSQGVPDPRAVLVYDEAPPGGERIKIYRWAHTKP
jgi:hypothetical protein